jgi:hypothetical protein
MVTKSEQIRLERLESYRNALRRYAYPLYEGDIDCVLHYMHEHYKRRPFIPAGFRQNLLQGLKAINGYAAEHSIRFDDALLVLHGYANNLAPEREEAMEE